MKIQILTLVVLSFLMSSCFQSALTNYQIQEDRAFLLLTPQTTKAELTSIAQEFLEKKNIEIDFAKSTFDKEGEIQELNLAVDCNDGFKGTTTSNKILMANKAIGFERNYREDATTPFSIGGI